MIQKPGRPKVKVVDVSIDFDFFVREDFLWDWGHTEHPIDSPMFMLFMQNIWDLRYREQNLHELTDMKKYADFKPQEIFTQLRDRGILAGDKMQLGISESHRDGLVHFGGALSPPDMFINIDAHHDLYTEPKERGVDCGNWITSLYDRWKPKKDVQFVQLYPVWQKRGSDATPVDQHANANREVEAYYFHNWRGMKGPGVIRNIFFCRSGEWVPPHHDECFFATAALLINMARGWQEYTRLLVRHFPTAEENAQYVEESRAQREEMVANILSAEEASE